MQNQRSDETHAPDFDPVLSDELEAIKARRADASRTDLSGLALSGGGIRSASFNLGVMQALAKRGWMNRFDYLSTVSGGGYIGSALTWMLARGRQKPRKGVAADFDTSAAGFPFGSQRPGRKTAGAASPPRAGAEPVKAARVAHIRQHGDYLSPDGEVTVWSLLAAVIRGLLVSLAVYFPLLLAIFAVLHRLHLYAPLYGADAHPRALLPLLWPAADAAGWQAPTLTYMAELALIAALAASIGSLLYAAVSRLLRSGRDSAGAGDFRLPFSAFAGRRVFDTFAGRLLGRVIVPLSLLATLPFADAWLGGALAGTLSALAGGLSSVAVFRAWKMLPRALLAPLAATLLVYGLLLLAFALTGPRLTPASLWWWPLPLAAAALLLGWLTNLNYLSVHRFYRDRLMEAFMPPRVDGEQPGDADRCTLASLADSVANAPYHLINTNAVLVDSRQARYRLRGGDAFVLSPLWCGSVATGWRRTEHFIEGRLTLPTAMAISGAAVNPNTGVGGQGVTRNRTLSALLVLLNLRLGFWVPNPARAAMQPGIANFIRPGLSALLATQSENDDWIELSDGGHFENLAVYELLRRRCRLIVCCDGAADPGFRFADLANLIVRARADLGVRIDLGAEDLHALTPHTTRDDEDVPTAERGFAVARISYDTDDHEGLLILLTTTFVDSLGADLVSYRRRNPAYPDQPTSDQFFDEQQFEAYRELGFTLAEDMMSKVRDAITAKGMDAEKFLAGLQSPAPRVTR